MWRTASLGPRVLGRRLSNQELLANYGGVIDRVRESIPLMLHKPLPKYLLHKNVVLQLLPESRDIEFRGRSAYLVSTKMLQIGISAFLLPLDSQLMILSEHIDPAAQIADRVYRVRWRSVTGDSETKHPQHLLDALRTGKILSSLNLGPGEYPVLAGSFEFRLSQDCNKVILHVIRDVEYLARPSVDPVM